MVQAAIGGILASLGIAAFFVGLQIVLFRVLGKLALDYSAWVAWTMRRSMPWAMRSRLFPRGHSSS